MRRNEPNRPNKIHPNASRSGSQSRRPGGTPKPPASTPEPPRAEAGPRPLSQQQRAYQDLRQGQSSPPETPIVPILETASAGVTSSRRVMHKRDATISRRRIVINRRRRNYPRLWLNIAAVGLGIEIIAALLFSPRLAVREIRVAGNQAVPTAQILAVANPLKGQNLLRFPVGKLHDAVLKEPTIETAEVRRVWPGSIRIQVRERQPWASVETADGQCYTIDSKLVPFRKGATPEPGLPRLLLSQAPVGGKLPSVVLGKKMTAPGLSEVSQCLEWAKARTDFPMETVSIDPTGKLCFNRVGGTQVQLGSSTDLSRKLSALGLLMQRYDIAEAAYVNLFAYDAPAVMPKNAVATASARTRSLKAPSVSRRRSGKGAADSTSEQQ